MKTFKIISYNIILLLLFIFPQIMFSQSKITLGELIQISSYKNWESANTYLQNNGWEYYESKKGNNIHYDIITWSFDKNRYNQDASGWLYLFTSDDVPNELIYLFFDLKAFNLIKNSLSNYGFYLKDSKIENGSLSSTYQNNNFILTSKTTKEDDIKYNPHTSYEIDIIKIGGLADENNGLKTEYYDNDSIKTEYFLKNGKINGVLKRYYNSGKISSIENYINDERNGIYKKYNEDGKLILELEMKNDIKNGYFKKYFDNGKLAVSGKYKNDLEDGLFETYSYNDKDEREVSQYFNYSNGMFNGKVKRYISDTIIDSDTIEEGYIEANYLNNILDGNYKLYTTSTWWDEETNKQSNYTAANREGEYVKGKKEGLWKYYWIGNLSEEGSFENDLKTGIWKKYCTLKFINSPDNDNNNLISTSQYKNGKLNGESITYFNFEMVVDSNRNKENNIKIWVFKKIFEKTIINYYNDKKEGLYEEIYPNGKLKIKCEYKNDLIDGLYTVWDSLGNINIKGNLIKGLKDSVWFERLDNGNYRHITYLNDNKNGYIEERDYYSNILVTGNYLNNMKDGKWTFYENNQVTAIENYLSDKLNGETLLYDKNILIFKILYNNDNVSKTFKYADNKIIEEKDLLKIEYKSSTIKDNNLFRDNLYKKVASIYNVRITKYRDGDTTEIQDYNIQSEEFPSDSLIYSCGIKEGDYNLTHLQSTIVKGEYHNGLKDASWSYYFSDDIVCNQFYNDGKLTSEYYIINHPIKDEQYPKYSGILNIYYSNNVIKEKISIKNGYRNGLTKYYDIRGEKVKQEKYKDGIWIK